MTARALAAVLIVCLSSQGLAAPVASSPRPMPRPDSAQADAARPMPRPMAQQPARMAVLRPMPRPDPLARKSPKQSLRGAVCENPSIRGAAIARVTSQVKGCGIAKPVRVTEIGAIRLKPAAVINCDTAAALDKWIKTSVIPTFGTGQVVQLQIAASYSCRGRNNVKDARISEHGRGNAIDIAGFVLANGQVKTVAKTYDKTLRKVHKGACGIFGTTLGPGSDGYHEDHLHFDVARHRGGAYCR